MKVRRPSQKMSLVGANVSLFAANPPAGAQSARWVELSGLAQVAASSAQLPRLTARPLKTSLPLRSKTSVARNLVSPLGSFWTSMQVLVGMGLARILPRFSERGSLHVVQESHRLSLA